MLSNSIHKSVSFLGRLFSREKGAVIAETAIILPVSLAILAGIFELSMYILINNKLLRVAGVIGDTITRQNTTAANVVAIMNTSYNLFQPFTFTPNGSIVVTQVSNSKMSNLAADNIINWQYSINGGGSRLGTTGSTPVNMPNGLFATSNISMVITEVFYNYQPIVFKNIIPAKQLYITTVYVPRVGDMNTLAG